MQLLGQGCIEGRDDVMKLDRLLVVGAVVFRLLVGVLQHAGKQMSCLAGPGEGRSLKCGFGGYSEGWANRWFLLVSRQHEAVGHPGQAASYGRAHSYVPASIIHGQKVVGPGIATDEGPVIEPNGDVTGLIVNIPPGTNSASGASRTVLTQ